jgi:polyisoprenoid-binding protein YceI
MNRRTLKATTLTLAVAALGLLALASSAQASSLNLKCSGKGVQNKAQEYETASCTVEAGKTRNIEGVLRNNKNKPVASTLKVTISDWNLAPGGGAFDIEPTKTFEVKSGANGKFTVPNVTTKTEETVYIEAVENFESEVSPVTQEVNIQRYVSATAKVLGGGKVKVTVKGIEGPFKVSIASEGYPVSGGAARKANKAGVATFNLGRAFGTLGIYVDAGELTDLYYIDAHPFKL